MEKWWSVSVAGIRVEGPLPRLQGSSYSTGTEHFWFNKFSEGYPTNFFRVIFWL